MFAYCGNNSIIRKDDNSYFRLFSAAVKIGAGLATQYVGDVINNIRSGQTGLSIFKRCSSYGDYVAAGITAIIPRSGIEGALVRNMVSEGISMIEDSIICVEVNIVSSMMNVGIGTLLDAGVEKISGVASDQIMSKAPQNYSSHAHTVRQSHPNASYQEIYRSMKRSIIF